MNWLGGYVVNKNFGKKPFKKPYGKKPFQKGKRPKFPPKKKPKRSVPAPVKELAQLHNITVSTAFKIYRNELTPEQAIDEDIAKEERKREAEEMCAKHPNLNLALACLLVKQKITPEEFYAQKEERKQRLLQKDTRQKQKMQEDESQRPAYDMLEFYCQQQTPLVLVNYGLRSWHGTLKDFTPYEFLFVKEDVPQKLHRLETKYFYAEEDAAIVEKWIVMDKSIQKKKMRAAYKPDKRYKFPEGILQEGAEIMLALHEGEMIRGRIIWFTPYDILLEISKNAKIWIFRHAAWECALLRRPVKK